MTNPSDFSGPRPSVEEVLNLIRKWGELLTADEQVAAWSEVRAAVASLEKPPEGSTFGVPEHSSGEQQDTALTEEQL